MPIAYLHFHPKSIYDSAESNPNYIPSCRVGLSKFELRNTRIMLKNY